MNLLKIEKFHWRKLNSWSEKGGFFISLMRVGLTLAKNILLPLGITTATSATNAAIQKKFLDRGQN